MNTHKDALRFEYPDAAGYPDGAGFLDEGTAANRDDDTDIDTDIDRPSVEAEFEVTVHRDDNERSYSATAGGRTVATIRYDEVDGRIVIVDTTVVPEFRGRGIAGELIAFALDDIRSRGMHVTVYCPTVAHFMSSNLQFADVLDPIHPGR